MLSRLYDGMIRLYGGGREIWGKMVKSYNLNIKGKDLIIDVWGFGCIFAVRIKNKYAYD